MKKSIDKILLINLYISEYISINQNPGSKNLIANK